MNWTRSKRTAILRSCRSYSIWISEKIKSLASRRPPFKGLTTSPTCKSLQVSNYTAFVALPLFLLCDIVVVIAVVFLENFAFAGTIEAILEIPLCNARIIFFAWFSSIVDIFNFRKSLSRNFRRPHCLRRQLLKQYRFFKDLSGIVFVDCVSRFAELNCSY